MMKAQFINVAHWIVRASVLLIFCLASASAQQTGVITGRVMTEDGGGLANVTVILNAVGSHQQGANPGHRATIITDEEGEFRFTDLPPRNYSVFVLGAKGYVHQPASASESGSRGYYRIGDHVTFTLIHGAAITGRVTTSAGEPMIGVRVTAVMVKDFEGAPVRQPFGSRSRSTDDRGVYRLYGLQPGTYLVSTAPNSGASRISAYEGATPTYYPSSPRETAAEVTVASGGEATGIDIRYRGERGHTVSGTVTGGGGASEQYAGAAVTLYGLASGFVVGTGYVRQSEGQNGFAIHGVSDGEYEIIARRGAGDKNFASAPRRVTVRGADAGGIALKLAPLASISGKIVVEASPKSCESKRKSSLEEIIVSVRPDTSATAASPFAFFQPDNAMNEKGEFTIHSLYPGRYFLEPRLPDENWRVKSIIAAPVAATARQSSASAKSTANNDVGRNGLAVKSGDKIAGLTVTIADGAASLQGKVAAEKPGARLPERLRVHLIPAEVGDANDVLRYAETFARPDGRFAFGHLAPGRYWLLTRAATEDDARERPEAWDGWKRASLRREAEAGRQQVELQACQRLTGHALLFKQKQ